MKNNEFPTFLEALNRHLKEKDDDITKLAKRAGVSRDALYKVSYGKTRTPSLEVVIKVANAYDETVEEFMGLSPVQVSGKLAQRVAQLSQREQAILEASLDVFLSQPQQESSKDE